MGRQKSETIQLFSGGSKILSAAFVHMLNSQMQSSVEFCLCTWFFKTNKLTNFKITYILCKIETKAERN